MAARKDGKIRSDSKLFGCWDEAVHLYHEGFSTKELGERFGIDASNVYRTFVLQGVKLRTRSESIKMAFSRGRGNLAIGSDRFSWKGGYTFHSSGYVLVKKPKHHRADGRGYVHLAIIVAEKKIGRRIRKGEHVHHIDGNKTNNVPSNLLVFSASEHIKLHHRQGDMKGLKLGPVAMKLKAVG